MVKDLITKWREINAHTSSQENRNKREEGRGGQETYGVPRNVEGGYRRRWSLMTEQDQIERGT